MQRTPLQLFIGFSKIGLSGFGGVLPWARRTIVEEEAWLSSEEFSAILGVCQVVPGPNIVNLAVCVGAHFAGIRGAIASVLGITLGPIAVVILLAILHQHFSHLEAVQGMLRGISAVGVGLIAVTGLKMLRDELRYPPMMLVIAAMILAVTQFHLGLGLVVIIIAPFALYFAWRKANRR